MWVNIDQIICIRVKTHKKKSGCKEIEVKMYIVSDRILQ